VLSPDRALGPAAGDRGTVRRAAGPAGGGARTGRPRPAGGEPARFALAVADGACRVSAGAADRPAARARIASDDLIRLAGGAASWPELFSSGRFELSGDPFLALRFAALFRLPVELEPISASPGR